MTNITKSELERRAAATQQEPNMADQANQEEVKVGEIKFVKMTRNPDFYDAPHEANVHPKEVSNFARGGWEIV